MKQILLVTLFAFISTITFSQSRLNYSADEIRQEFSSSQYNLKSSYDKDGNYFISILTGNSTIYYYFNANKICKLTFIVPDNQGALNAYVETYNNRYVIISPTQWKMYTNNGVAEVKLVYNVNGGYYFMWND